MTCPHCAEKDERIAWLESELGLQRSANEMGMMREAFPVRPMGASCTGLAFSVILALYHAKGTTLSVYQLMERIPPKSNHEDDRIPHGVAVWVYRARQILGDRDAIENVWGRGYRLSEEAMARVRAVLGGA